RRVLRILPGQASLSLAQIRFCLTSDGICSALCTDQLPQRVRIHAFGRNQARDSSAACRDRREFRDAGGNGREVLSCPAGGESPVVRPLSSSGGARNPQKVGLLLRPPGSISILQYRRSDSGGIEVLSANLHKREN